MVQFNVHEEEFMLQSPRKLKYIVVAVALCCYAGNLVVTAGGGPRAVVNSGSKIQSAAAPKPEVVTLKRLGDTSARNNAIVTLQPAKREPGGMFKLSTPGGGFLFRDDGAGGDEEANDGKFSSLITVDFRALAEDQQAFESDIIRADGDTRIPVFDGRIVVGEQVLEFPRSDGEIRVGQEITLTPMAIPRGVDPARSLLIDDPRVIEDPTRTFNPCTKVGTPMGKWTFGYLMQQMANQAQTGINPSTFVRNWLRNWELNLAINGWSVPARFSVRN